MPVAALISAAGTLGSAALVNHMQKKRYERELKDQQKAWQMNNAYNSPSQQMARLKSAGLNPNLVYMNGGTSATSDTMTTPSFDSTPIADFTSAAQMFQQSPLLMSQVAKNKAETETIASENKDRFSPLSKLYNLNEDEKKYYAQQYGISVEQMDSYNMNRVQLLAGLKKASSENENLREMYNLIVNNVNQSESEAMTARLYELFTRIELETESKKRGFGLNVGSESYRSAHSYNVYNPSTYYRIFKDGSNDKVFDMFLRELKEMHWQSSDGKHILDQFHQFMNDIPSIGSLRRGKPTIRGIERSGYDRNRGSWYTYDRYDYGK